ncbi:MAG: (d)CMP kinase [Planctomycetota bacterium]|jgi:cytidylate kinase
MIVTIDGPAGAGKSTAARELARQIGFSYLDTGAMYRAVTWLVLERDLDPADETAVAETARAMEIEFDSDRVWVNGQDVTRAIRTAAVNANISTVSDHPQVRAELVRRQRIIADTGNYVCEGRDQGSVAFPDAGCKIYLTASPEARARRRCLELAEKKEPSDYASILAQQKERDRRDESRPVGRLLKAPGAVELVTDDLSLAEVVARLKHIVSRELGLSFV